MTFSLLLCLTLVKEQLRQRLWARPWRSWILDGCGLICQGLGIPLLQLVLMGSLYSHLWPQLQHSWQLSPILVFLLSFLGVDYLYYWNHRLLHTGLGWPLHQVHHTLTEMDVLGTSRNTLWSSLFILYLWIHSFFVYVLVDPSSYLLAANLTAALDLWRHSGWQVGETDRLYKLLSPWLILPQDHARHHTQTHTTFGANFKLWDRIHNTYTLRDSRTLETPKLVMDLPLWKQLIWPFS